MARESLSHDLVRLRIAEDAAFLWLLRVHSLRAPNCRLSDLVRLDERLEAHLDSLRIAGEAGWAFAHGELRTSSPGAVFAAASLAIASFQPERLEQALAAPGDDILHPAISALAWAERTAAVPAIDRLATASDPTRRAIAIAAWGARRIDPGTALARALEDPDPAPRAAACRTAAQLARLDLLPRITALTTDSATAFAAAWSAARLGVDTLAVLAEIAWQAGPHAPAALDMMLRRLPAPAAHAWLRELAARQPDRQRDLIRGAAAIGDPSYIPWLIERMNTPALARLAGEAFSAITGADLAYRDLDRRAPQDHRSGPTDDPADPDVSLDEDDRLPWPDPARVTAWWTVNRSRMPPGTPHFLGQPKPTSDLLRALAEAFQRQRRTAALELALRAPNRAMFEVRARGRLQRATLARAAR